MFQLGIQKEQILKIIDSGSSEDAIAAGLYYDTDLDPDDPDDPDDPMYGDMF